jgi:hypothetical protein
MSKLRSDDASIRTEGARQLASMHISDAVASTLVFSGALKDICDMISACVANGTSGDALCVQLYSIVFKIGAMSEYCRHVAEALSGVLEGRARPSMCASVRSARTQGHVSVARGSMKGGFGANMHASFSSHTHVAPESDGGDASAANAGKMLMQRRPIERIVRVIVERVF